MSSNYRVIVIDDDEISRVALCACLEGEGVASVRSARSGIAALNMLKEDPDVDAIALDVYMPDMDGIEFMRELGQRNFEGGVILMSGDSVILKTSQSLGKVYGVDVWAALHKPFSVQDFMRAIKSNS